MHTVEAKKEQILNVLRTDSSPVNGNEQLVEYLKELFTLNGFYIKLQKVDHSLEGISPHQYNILASYDEFIVDPTTPEGVLFLSHIDSPRLEQPGNVIIENNKIYGAHGSETKLDLLVKFWALEKLREKKLKRPIFLAGTCASALGMLGSRYLVEGRAIHPEYVWVSMPTAMELVEEHKGLLSFQSTFSFKSVPKDPKAFNRKVCFFVKTEKGPLADPQIEKNAIETLLRLLKDFLNKGFQIRVEKIHCEKTSISAPSVIQAEVYIASPQVEDFKRLLEKQPHVEGIKTSVLNETAISFYPEDLFQCILHFSEEIEKMNFELQAEKNMGFNPPYATVCLNYLRTSHQKLELFYEVRFLPSGDVESIKNKIENLTKNILEYFPQYSLSTSLLEKNAAFRGFKGRHSKGMELSTEVLKKHNFSEKLVKPSYCSEGGVFVENSYDTSVIGVGVPYKDTLKKDHPISLEELDRAVCFYEEIARNLCDSFS